jgi:hypothetical protein
MTRMALMLKVEINAYKKRWQNFEICGTSSRYRDGENNAKITKRVKLAKI